MSVRPFPLIASIVVILLMQKYCVGQEKSKVQYGKVSAADFVVPASIATDTTPNAVILGDFGSIHFVGNSKGWFSYVYKRQTRILILHRNAIGLATVGLRLYSNDAYVEKLDNIQASTYNLSGGQVVETKLDKKDIFEERIDKDNIRKKWTLPAVQEGSIIEYTYTETSPFYHTLPAWDFQSMEYPTAWSEYEVEIPQALFYVTVRQGVHGYVVDKGSEGKGTYQVQEVNDDPRLNGVNSGQLIVSAMTVKHRWAMKDVPAFRVENYLTTPRNYVDRISFQLEKTYNGRDTEDFMNSWKKANEELLRQSSFGQPLTEDNAWLDGVIDKASQGATDRLTLAKKLYYYVSSHITCTDYYNYHIRTGLRDVVKSNSGTVGDVNLLLIAMLRKMQFTADPVLLSTREYGFNLIKYPILNMLNYVIVRVVIDGKVYYLDAAHPKLGFGQLAGNCYNGHARVISEKDSMSVYFEADSLKETKSTIVFMVNGQHGLEGTYQTTVGPQQSYNIREQVAEQGIDAFFKHIQAQYGEDAEIRNGAIDSLDQLEMPLAVRYEFDLHRGGDASLIYFNPIMGDAMKENPFKAAERKYPVEMPYAMDQVYVLNMEIPTGYVVDELPKSARVAFNGDQGMFEYLIARQENTIQLRCRIKMDHANFLPEDYGSLREFFAFIVKKENEQIVLKKQ